MASGCIIGKCPLCDDWIWEDEEIIFGPDVFYHKRCLNKKQVKTVEVYASEEIQADLQLLKSTMQYCLSEIERIENSIMKK